MFQAIKMILDCRRHFLFQSATALSFYISPEKFECLDISGALALIREQCPPFFLNAVRESRCFLYRGETVDCPTILSPVPDLLSLSTYSEGQDAVDFFMCLEEKFSSFNVRPSLSHIVTASRSQASLWGPPVTVWPLGSDFGYAWPKHRPLFYPGECNASYSINSDFVSALREKREVMLSSKSFLVVPARFELQLEDHFF